MKCRSGFVSNSSSSSFVIIGNSGKFDKLKPYEPWTNELNLTLIEHIDTFFGWGPETIQDINSRIAFAMLQCDAISKIPYNYELNDPPLRGSETRWGKMLIDLINHDTGLDLVWKLPPESYIDHQSRADEGQNTEIFNDEKTLRKFIFDHDSKIELDNDNH